MKREEGNKVLVLDERNHLRVEHGARQEEILGRFDIVTRQEQILGRYDMLHGPLVLDPEVGGLWLSYEGPPQFAFWGLNKLRVHWKLWKKKGGAARGVFRRSRAAASQHVPLSGTVRKGRSGARRSRLAGVSQQ